MALTGDEEQRLEELLSAYEARRWKYELLASRVKRFMTWKTKAIFEGATGGKDLPTLHLVQARAKRRASLEANLRAGRYTHMRGDPPREVAIPLAEIVLDELKDLAAVRVIVYFKDNVDYLCDQLVGQKRLTTWFGPRSLTKWKDRSPSTPDAFGYESKHFPVFLAPGSELAKTVANDGFDSTMQCEVQLRTVLQHGWAEAEHDLRYKGLNPRTEKRDRQWAVIAALVAGADSMLEHQKFDFVPRSRHRPTPRTDDTEAIGSTGYLAHAHPTDVQLECDRTLFDVDAAMARRGLDGYKRKMRDVLQTNEPALLRGVDRDDLIVRVSAWPDGADRVRVQPALYSDGVVTNNGKALRQQLEGVEVRSLALRDGAPLPFDESPMANNLGVAMMVKALDGAWVLSVRGSAVAYEEGRLGCSVSGALTWAELVSGPAPSLIIGGVHSAQREAVEELGFAPAAAEIVYLGTKRELLRAGKPQMFFAARSALTAEQIFGRWNVRATEEYEQILFVEDRDARRVCTLSRFGGRIVSNELREALTLALAALPG